MERYQSGSIVFDISYWGEKHGLSRWEFMMFENGEEIATAVDIRTVADPSDMNNVINELLHESVFHIYEDELSPPDLKVAKESMRKTKELMKYELKNGKEHFLFEKKMDKPGDVLLNDHENNEIVKEHSKNAIKHTETHYLEPEKAIPLYLDIALPLVVAVATVLEDEKSFILEEIEGQKATNTLNTLVVAMLCSVNPAYPALEEDDGKAIMEEALGKVMEYVSIVQREPERDEKEKLRITKYFMTGLWRKYDIPVMKELHYLVNNHKRLIREAIIISLYAYKMDEAVSEIYEQTEDEDIEVAFNEFFYQIWLDYAEKVDVSNNTGCRKNQIFDVIGCTIHMATFEETVDEPNVEYFDYVAEQLLESLAELHQTGNVQD